MNIYLDSGFVDMKSIIEADYPFIIMTGARATGKTYGALKYVIEAGKKFIYMRRTKVQTNLISAAEMSPFQAVCSDMHITFEARKISTEVTGIYFNESENPAGYIMALSGIANLRGFSAADVQIIIYDEFIPEAHERQLKNEGDALFNAYETINRNRELSGCPAVKMVLLSNANRIVNPVFQSLGLIGVAYKMAETGQQIYKDRGRGLFIINLRNSPISEKKRETALYKLLQENPIVSMSLDNMYLDKPTLQLKSANLKEYKPIVTVGEITVYRHKSKPEKYISMHGQGSRPIYTTSENDIQRFRVLYRPLLSDYIARKIYCESPACEIIFCQYFRLID